MIFSCLGSYIMSSKKVFSVTFIYNLLWKNAFNWTGLDIAKFQLTYWQILFKTFPCFCTFVLEENVNCLDLYLEIINSSRENSFKYWSSRMDYSFVISDIYCSSNSNKAYRFTGFFKYSYWGMVKLGFLLSLYCGFVYCRFH